MNFMNNDTTQAIELKGKELAFALAYIELGPVKGRTTQAALKAGFSKASAATLGSRMLKKVEVASYVRAHERELVKKIEEKALVTREWIIEQLKEVYKQSMKAEPRMVWRDGECIHDGEWMFNDRGANRSLELLGKTIGMFSDKKDDKSTDFFNLTINLAPEAPNNSPTIEHQPARVADMPTVNLEG